MLQTDKSPKETSSKKELPPFIFQGIGTVRGIIRRTSSPDLAPETYEIEVEGKDYKLKRHWGKWHTSFTQLKPGILIGETNPVTIKVYPNVIHHERDRRTTSFSLLKVMSPEAAKEPPEFTLRGIWQRVDYCQDPVIIIRRNGSGKSKNAQILPVRWENPSVEPFIYQEEKERQMRRYFVQVKAKFEDEVFVVQELLKKPTLKFPK